MTIPRRTLGRLGHEVSALGLGCAALQSHLYGREHAEEDALAAVHRALELGIDYFDTSAGYGDSEERLGKALEGTPRESYFLATKTGTRNNPRHDYSADGTRRSVEESMRLLRTDRLDLVQIHDPNPEEVDAALSPEGALGVLLELKEQKAIGGVGIGVRDHAILSRAIEMGCFDTILTYGDFNPARQTARDDLFAGARARNMAVILGSPVLMGYLTDRPLDELLREQSEEMNRSEGEAARPVREWAEKHGLSITQLALQFALRSPDLSVVLVGSGSAEEVEANVRAAQVPIAQSLWKQFENDLNAHV
jgi:aryl-alcohol dehydrogenase-like predicted oxidoreductase